MRVVLDTNVLISALILSASIPNILYESWRMGRFDLITSKDQLEEFRRVTRYPRIQKYITPAAAGTMVNQLHELAIVLDKLPTLQVPPDPADNFLLAMALAGKAHFLVTGDKHDILHLRRHGQTKILSAQQFARVLKSS